MARTRTRRSIALALALALALLAGACHSTAPIEPAREAPPLAPAPAPAHPKPELLLPGQFAVQHFGVSIAGKKVGHSMQVTSADPHSGEYLVRQEAVLQLEQGGEPSVLLRHELRRYAAEAPHALIEARLTQAQDGVVTTRLLKHASEGWVLETEEDGQASTLAVAEIRETLEQVFERTRAAIDGEAPFQCSVEAFDLDAGRTRETRFHSKGAALVATSSGGLAARRVESLVEGEDATSELEYDASGHLLRLCVPGLFEIVAMDEAAANAPNGSIDVMLALSIPIGGLDERPDGARRMRLEWSGVDALLPERDSQHARWLKAGELQELVLELARTPSAEELAAPVPAEVRRELAADASCEVDDARIRALAAKIAPPSKNAWERTRRIVRWVDREVEDTYGSNRSTALGVLESKAGDCTEHTLLACALLRASGIPARRVAGVMVMDGEPPSFGHHAWIEVWIGRWIPVDPTWNQAPADATHVYFGDEDSLRFMAATHMSAKVLELERR